MYTKLMYLAIDIGGTKTLLAVFSPDGEIQYEHKIATSQVYDQLKTDLRASIDDLRQKHPFVSCCVATTGHFDYQTGIGIRFGNLPWQNVPLRIDLEQMVKPASLYIQNDASLAGLHEALLVHEKYRRVLYLTIGTGIGARIIINGMLDPNLSNSEVGFMMFERQGKLEEWEEFASGEALVRRFGKKAAEINDPKIWQSYAYDLAIGLQPLLATWLPDVVVVGGGVGTHFSKFSDELHAQLAKFRSHMVPIVPLLQAKKPEEAVIYGCYDFIKQQS